MRPSNRPAWLQTLMKTSLTRWSSARAASVTRRAMKVVNANIMPDVQGRRSQVSTWILSIARFEALSALSALGRRGKPSSTRPPWN
jgi:hypothetical protein